jgi:hypothetical protein
MLLCSPFITRSHELNGVRVAIVIACVQRSLGYLFELNNITALLGIEIQPANAGEKRSA